MKDFGEEKVCRMGHHYYPSISQECPICKKNGLFNDKNDSWFPSMDDDLTVAVGGDDDGFRPIAGWLVCVDGPMKGQDYRFYAENNFIGRDKNSDICLAKDESISRQKHATISYDGRSGKYYYTPGTGRNLDSINGKTILNTVELHSKDVLEVGKTKLIFIALCGEKFSWKDWEE